MTSCVQRVAVLYVTPSATPEETKVMMLMLENPSLETIHTLLGLNTLYDLALATRHKTDTRNT